MSVFSVFLVTDVCVTAMWALFEVPPAYVKRNLTRFVTLLWLVRFCVDLTAGEPVRGDAFCFGLGVLFWNLPRDDDRRRRRRRVEKTHDESRAFDWTGTAVPSAGEA